MDTALDTAFPSTAFSDTAQESSMGEWGEANARNTRPMDNEYGELPHNNNAEQWDSYDEYSTSQDPLFSQSVLDTSQKDAKYQRVDTDAEDVSNDNERERSLSSERGSDKPPDDSSSHGYDVSASHSKASSQSPSRRGSSESLLSSGNLDSLRHLVEIGAIDKLQQISSKYNKTNGATLLHRLAATRCTNIIHALLSHGCDAVNAQDNLGQTPLHVAVGTGHVNTAELLLSFGADVNVEDEQGRTPLHYCLNIDQEPHAIDHALTSLLLPNIDISISDFDGINTLHCLSFWDMWAQLELAVGLAHTARVKDNRGRTPLHYCFMNPLLMALDAAFVLLKADAGLLCKDFDGTTPMQRLMAHPLAPGNREVARFVRDFICHEMKDPATGQNLLHISVSSGDLNTVRFMGLCGVNVNEPDPVDHCTPLHGSVMRNQSEMVRALLEAGANPNLQDEHLQTPLHLAAIHARISAAKVLLAEGADPNLGDERGRTPLHCGVHSGSIDVVRLLLQSHCNVNALDKSDSLAIHYAAAENKLSMMELLLLKGSKVNRSDVEGRTPLHLAVATSNCDILRLLTLHGCSVNEYDKYGQTPLHMAAEIGNSEVVQTLMNRGANEKLRDAEGRRAEQVAIETGSIRVMNVMKEHRDSMIMYSQESLDDLDEDEGAPQQAVTQSRSNLPACVSNNTLDDIDECDDVLIEKDKLRNNGSNGLAALKRFESDENEKKRWKCCVIL